MKSFEGIKIRKNITLSPYAIELLSENTSNDSKFINDLIIDSCSNRDDKFKRGIADLLFNETHEYFKKINWEFSGIKNEDNTWTFRLIPIKPMEIIEKAQKLELISKD